MEELGDNTPAIQRHSLASPNKFRAENYRDFRAGRQKERARAPAFHKVSVAVHGCTDAVTMYIENKNIQLADLIYYVRSEFLMCGNLVFWKYHMALAIAK